MHITYIKEKLVALVDEYDSKIRQGSLEFLDEMLGELKKRFDKMYKTGSDNWVLTDTNISKLRVKMIQIIGSDLNIQRMKDDINNDLGNIFNSQQTSSKKETKSVELTKQLTEMTAKLQLN